MASAFPPPDPQELHLLLGDPTFQHPTQRAILAAFAAGEADGEDILYQLLAEVKHRAPHGAEALAVIAQARAERARQLAEMADNRTVAEPPMVYYRAAAESGKGNAASPAAGPTNAP